MNKQRGHDADVHHIVHNPGIIGLDGIVLSTDEAVIREGGVIKGAPDGLFFDPSTHRLYMMEYKQNAWHRNKAVYQLERNLPYIKEVFPRWDVRKLYVHDKHLVEEIR